MIEPHSAQLGASAWVWKLTRVPPRFRLIGDVPPPPLAAPLPLLVALPFAAMVAFEAIDTVTGGCSEGELRVFREFPQYGGKQLEPEYSGSNGCFVAFTTDDSPERVLTHYRQQLTARGWTLDPPPPPVDAPEGQTAGGGLSASRGNYGYQALLESPTANGTSVVVYVIEREG